jgi:hypothetical protein
VYNIRTQTRFAPMVALLQGDACHWFVAHSVHSAATNRPLRSSSCYNHVTPPINRPSLAGILSVRNHNQCVIAQSGFGLCAFLRARIERMDAKMQSFTAASAAGNTQTPTKTCSCHTDARSDSCDCDCAATDIPDRIITGIALESGSQVAKRCLGCT